MPTPPQPDQLIGRKDELALLASVFEAAGQGKGKVAFITGEGGIGKTRLATAAAEAAVKRGWTSAIGRAYPVETGVPYALFADALVPLIRKLDPSALSVLTRGGAGDLAYMFPALADDRARPRPDAGDASEMKARLLWSFAQFLGKLSARQPLLIMLDNLQWADASTLELLHFVARQIESQKIVLLCTYNEAERDANPVLKTTENSLHRLGLLTVLRLQPLSESNIAELVQKKFAVDEQTARPFVSLLYGWTRGNPFFVEETLKALMDSGRLQQIDGRWTGWDLQTFELPLTVRDAVSARIKRLSPTARSLANIAAVLGARASYDTLVAVAGLQEEQFVPAIEELTSQRVLEERRDDQGVSYDFSHPLIQQVLYGDLGHARVRQLHGGIAESLEARYAARAMKHADELAFHFARAGTFGGKAVKYLVAAGKAALAQSANREATMYLSAALDALDNSGADASRTLADVSRREVVESLARARQRLGEYDAALELWGRALAESEKAGDSAGVAEVEYRMGLACYWSGRHTDAIAHYDAGLAAASKVEDTAPSLRLRLARGICLQELGRIEEAKSDLETALASAISAGVGQALLARAHRSLLFLYAWTAPLDLARKHGEDALRHAEATGQLMLQWNVHWGLSLLEGFSGEAAALARHIAECERLAEQIKSPLLPLWSAEVSVQYLWSLGEWDAALDIAERTIVQAQKLGQRMLLPRLYVWAGMMLLPRGQIERAKSYFDLAWTQAEAGKAKERPADVNSVIPAHLGLAAYHLATGNFTEAARIGEAGLAIADRTGHAVWGLQWLLPLICEALLLGLEFDRAEEHSRRMRRDATRLQHKLGLAFSDGCDAMLVLFRDSQPEKAVPLLRSAAEKVEAISVPLISARIRRRLADALADCGQREEAMREYRSAHDTFVRLRASAELDPTRESMRKVGVRPPSRSAVAGAAGLTGREMEISRMVALRKSNKEIGGALKISARTVSTHLSNIFLKLSVESRGQLADFVRENGLLET